MVGWSPVLTQVLTDTNYQYLFQCEVRYDFQSGSGAISSVINFKNLHLKRWMKSHWSFFTNQTETWTWRYLSSIGAFALVQVIVQIISIGTDTGISAMLPDNPVIVTLLGEPNLTRIIQNCKTQVAMFTFLTYDYLNVINIKIYHGCIYCKRRGYQWLRLPKQY